MKFYELTYLISPNLTETEVKNFQEKMSSLIQKKGVLVDIQFPRKRKLTTNWCSIKLRFTVNQAGRLAIRATLNWMA